MATELSGGENFKMLPPKHAMIALYESHQQQPVEFPLEFLLRRVNNDSDL